MVTYIVTLLARTHSVLAEPVSTPLLARHTAVLRCPLRVALTYTIKAHTVTRTVVWALWFRNFDF